MRSARWAALSGALSLGIFAAACGGDPERTPGSCEGASCSAGGGKPQPGGQGGAAPWYDVSLDKDTSYLPMGPKAFQVITFPWDSGDEHADVDVYTPEGMNAPVVIMLPGVAISADRYTWFGSVLASHGVAVAVVGRKAQFATSIHTTVTLSELTARAADPKSPLFGKIDVSRLILAGHSEGTVVQAGLTDISSCPKGFCKDGATTPDGIRGLIMMAFHMETGEDPAVEPPIAAIEAPWLLLYGERDGLTTPAKAAATVSRMQDRPVYPITIKGMNHYQFTDYVNPDSDVSLANDNTPTIPNKAARARAAEYAVRFVERHLLGDSSVPDDLGASKDAAVKADVKPAVLSDPGGSGLPLVASEPFGQPGLDGTADNTDVVATAEYAGALYMLVRNDAMGAEVWRLRAGALEQVPFPDGAKNGVYGNKLVNCLLGAMTVFQGKLWVGFSSGVQGSMRGSTGAEVWTYDGTSWAPVVSDRADPDPEVTITSISGCDDNDGDVTAQITVSGLSMAANEWAQGVADDIDAGGDAPHIFDIVGNTAATLTVKLNEVASKDEFAVCNGLGPGSKLKLRRGLDESGFGQPWNKAITGMAVLGGRLYVGSGLNLDQGAEVYVTGDGKSFSVAVPRAFFGKHPTGEPLTSSISTLQVSDVTGSDVLYFGGTGTQGYGSRLAALTAGGAPRFVIDNSVDADDTGLDEAGNGHGNYQIPSMVTFGGRLWLANFNFDGLEILSTQNPFDPAGFKVEVGKEGRLGPGFGDTTQITPYLSVVSGELWAATVDLAQNKDDLIDHSGAALRTKDGTHWQLATAHAFGVNAVGVTRVFDHDGVTYAVSSRASLNTKASFGPLRMYTLRDEKYAQ